jgi:hypothetical protein
MENINPSQVIGKYSPNVYLKILCLPLSGFNQDLDFNNHKSFQYDFVLVLEKKKPIRALYSVNSCSDWTILEWETCNVLLLYSQVLFVCITKPHYQNCFKNLHVQLASINVKSFPLSKEQ